MHHARILFTQNLILIATKIVKILLKSFVCVVISLDGGGRTTSSFKFTRLAFDPRNSSAVVAFFFPAGLSLSAALPPRAASKPAMFHAALLFAAVNPTPKASVSVNQNKKHLNNIAVHKGKFVLQHCLQCSHLRIQRQTNVAGDICTKCHTFWMPNNSELKLSKSPTLLSSHSSYIARSIYEDDTHMLLWRHYYYQTDVQFTVTMSQRFSGHYWVWQCQWQMVLNRHHVSCQLNEVSDVLSPKRCR